MICVPLDEDYAAWVAGLHPKAKQAHEPAAAERQVIGYVTSGGFSFRRGAGFALGFVSVAGLQALIAASRRKCVIVLSCLV